MHGNTPNNIHSTKSPIEIINGNPLKSKLVCLEHKGKNLQTKKNMKYISEKKARKRRFHGIVNQKNKSQSCERRRKVTHAYIQGRTTIEWQILIFRIKIYRLELEGRHLRHKAE